MKKYKLDNLKVLTIQNNENILHNQTKLICESHWDVFNNEFYWKEIFTGQKFTKSDHLKTNFSIDPFWLFFPSLMEICKECKFSKIELLPYYNELNKVELLSNTDEKDIENYLKSKKIFKYSKIYLKRYR